jgi:hypothetical protein
MENCYYNVYQVFVDEKTGPYKEELVLTGLSEGELKQFLMELRASETDDKQELDDYEKLVYETNYIETLFDTSKIFLIDNKNFAFERVGLKGLK